MCTVHFSGLGAVRQELGMGLHRKTPSPWGCGDCAWMEEEEDTDCWGGSGPTSGAQDGEGKPPSRDERKLCMAGRWVAAR